MARQILYFVVALVVAAGFLLAGAMQMNLAVRVPAVAYSSVSNAPVIELYTDQPMVDTAVTVDTYTDHDLQSYSMTLTAVGASLTDPDVGVILVVRDESIRLRPHEVYPGPQPEALYTNARFPLQGKKPFDAAQVIRSELRVRNVFDGESTEEEDAYLRERDIRARAFISGSFVHPPATGAGLIRRVLPQIMMCTTREYLQPFSSLVSEEWISAAGHANWYRPRCPESSSLHPDIELYSLRYGGGGDGGAAYSDFVVDNSNPILQTIGKEGDPSFPLTRGFSARTGTRVPEVDISVSSRKTRTVASQRLVVAGLLFGIGGSVIAALIVEVSRRLLYNDGQSPTKGGIATGTRKGQSGAAPWEMAHEVKKKASLKMGVIEAVTVVIVLIGEGVRRIIVKRRGESHRRVRTSD